MGVRVHNRYGLQKPNDPRTCPVRSALDALEPYDLERAEAELGPWSLFRRLLHGLRDHPDTLYSAFERQPPVWRSDRERRYITAAFRVDRYRRRRDAGVPLGPFLTYTFRAILEVSPHVAWKFWAEETADGTLPDLDLEVLVALAETAHDVAPGANARAWDVSRWRHDILSLVEAACTCVTSHRQAQVISALCSTGRLAECAAGPALVRDLADRHFDVFEVDPDLVAVASACGVSIELREREPSAVDVFMGLDLF